MKKYPGIFNDVIGPVMRGPSSSHTAASWRIARIALDILNDELVKALAEFEENGAWATNFREQGTAMGLSGGLFGLEMTDERMKNAEDYVREQGLSISYEISSFPAEHPNTVRLTLWGNSGKNVQIIAVSTGGGSFEITSVNGFNASIRGDYFEMILFFRKNKGIVESIHSILHPDCETESIEKNGLTMTNCKSSIPFAGEMIQDLMNRDIEEICIINPVMPVISGKEVEMPFQDISSMLQYASEKDVSLGDMGLLYEKCLSGLPDRELVLKMKEIINLTDHGIDIGLAGTEFSDRILHHQSFFPGRAVKSGKIPELPVVNKMIAYVSALMESKSAMEIIVAAPTAGSCGTLGGTIRAVAEYTGASGDKIVNAYFAAGITGAFFAKGAGFSAEEFGCQVECGAASGMAAAGVADLLGGTAKEAMAAASMAIQNMIGLICDPVADRVEVPCLGKNVSAAMNAVSSAIMALSGFDVVIPLEEVIQTVLRVGKEMPSCVRCTGLGGLAITDTALKLKEQLRRKNPS